MLRNPNSPNTADPSRSIAAMEQLQYQPPAKFSYELYCLGGLHVHRGGCELAVPPFRSQPLLAALCLRPGLARREQLAGLLFPDLPESTAKARLSDRLWLLKSSLPGLPLEATSNEIRLPKEKVWIDVDTFRVLLGTGNPSDRSRAVGLYKGDLWPELDNEWLLLERENLHIQYTRALQILASASLAAGDPFQAIPLLERLYRLEGYDEGNLRSLLRAYQSTGQRGKALDMYEKFRRVLRTELEIEPEAATQAVVEAIRSQARPCPELETDLQPSGTWEQRLRAARAAIWQGKACKDQDLLITGMDIHAPSQKASADLLRAEAALLTGDARSARRLMEGRTASSTLDVQAMQIRILACERDYSAVVEKAGPVIQAAHMKKDRLMETLLLVDLGTAQQRTGNSLQAMRCANQVITLADRAGLPYPLAWGYYLKASLLGSQGFERDAIEILHHARAHAAEHEFRPLLVKVERTLGTFYQQSGKYADSLRHYDLSLELARDLGLVKDEAEILHNRAVTYSAIGRNREGILDIEQAGVLWEQTGDQLGIARNLYQLAFSLAYEEHSDLEHVLQLADRALSIFLQHQALGWIASMYALLGYVFWLKGEPDRSIEACQAAIPIYQQLEEVDYIPELYAYIGLSMLQKGEVEQAQVFTGRAMDEMMRGELYDIASEIYFAHAMALFASGSQDKGWEHIQLAYENLLVFAAEIHDAQARQAFFRRDPTVRRLMEKVYQLGIATPPLRVTSNLTTPHHAPLQVELTLDAGPADQALKNARGEVSLRRARIQRIRQQAHEQGGQVPAAELALIMKVSLRTIQRDLTWLAEFDS